MVAPRHRNRYAHIAVAALLGVSPGSTAAQEAHTHDQEAAHHAGLHFSHPLFTESVSPDTKVRLNAGRAWEADGTETEFEFEAEYGFHRAFSIEVAAPFAILDHEGGSRRTGLGNLEALFKFANYAFEEHGLLLGYGIEVAVPTGNGGQGIGSDHIWEVEPVFNIGLKRGRLELVGFAKFGIPFNQRSGEEVETELAYDVSALAHLTQQVQALIEINGETVLRGGASGQTVVLLSPGAKLAPAAGVPLFIGLGARVPLTEGELDLAVRVSAFYHF